MEVHNLLGKQEVKRRKVVCWEEKIFTGEGSEKYKSFYSIFP
jgi:hypothetical protein